MLRLPFVDFWILIVLFVGRSYEIFEYSIEPDEWGSTYWEEEKFELEFSAFEEQNEVSNEWKISNMMTKERRETARKTKWNMKELPSCTRPELSTYMKESHHKADESCALCGDKLIMLNCHGDIIDSEGSTLNPNPLQGIFKNLCGSGIPEGELVPETGENFLQDTTRTTSSDEKQRSQPKHATHKAKQKIKSESLAGDTNTAFSSHVNFKQLMEGPQVSDEALQESKPQNKLVFNTCGETKRKRSGYDSNLEISNESSFDTKPGERYFSREAKKKLQAVFAADRYPDRNEKIKLARKFNVPVSEITHWFEKKPSLSKDNPKCVALIKAKKEYQQTLQEYFAVNRNPDAKEKEMLAKKLQVTVPKIARWYVNKHSRTEKNKLSENSTSHGKDEAQNSSTPEGYLESNSFKEDILEQVEDDITEDEFMNLSHSDSTNEVDESEMEDSSEQAYRNDISSDASTSDASLVSSRKQKQEHLKILEYFEASGYPDTEEKRPAHEFGGSMAQTTGFCNNHYRNTKISDREYQKTLQEYFEVNRNPSTKEKYNLAYKLKVSVAEITKWFSNQHQHYSETLKASFITNPLPDATEKERLADKLRVSVKTIAKWFSNKRHRT